VLNNVKNVTVLPINVLNVKVKTEPNQKTVTVKMVSMMTENPLIVENATLLVPPVLMVTEPVPPVTTKERKLVTNVSVNTVLMTRTENATNVTPDVKLVTKDQKTVLLVQKEEMKILLQNVTVQKDNMKRTENVLNVTTNVPNVTTKENVPNVLESEKTHLLVNVHPDISTLKEMMTNVPDVMSNVKLAKTPKPDVPLVTVTEFQRTVTVHLVITIPAKKTVQNVVQNVPLVKELPINVSLVNHHLSNQLKDVLNQTQS